MSIADAAIESESRENIGFLLNVANRVHSLLYDAEV